MSGPFQATLGKWRAKLPQLLRNKMASGKGGCARCNCWSGRSPRHLRAKDVLPDSTHTERRNVPQVLFLKEILQSAFLESCDHIVNDFIRSNEKNLKKPVAEEIEYN